jgi:peptide/nickel transport system permease protein
VTDLLSPPTDAAPSTAGRRPHRHPLRRAARAVATNPSLLVGTGLLLAFLALSLLHPVFMRTIWAGDTMAYRPVAGFDTSIAVHPSPPSLRHWLGTDSLGRDVLSMLMVAIRPTLVTALVAALTIGVTSVVAAATAAFRRGAPDTLVVLVADALVLLPAPVVIILVAIAFPPDVFGPAELGLLYGLLAGLSTATIILRSQAIAVMARPFMEASRVAGGGSFHVIRTHLVPHLLPLAFVQMMVGVVGVVIAVAFAQYLTHPNDTLGLGTLLYSGLTYQGFAETRIAWNLLLSGALSITGLSAAFFLIGRGAQQLTDPRTTAARR